MDDQTLLEQFRVLVSSELIAKGVQPPEPDDEKEQVLFLQWKYGHEKLRTLSGIIV
jgi:hypothetical protein